MKFDFDESRLRISSAAGRTVCSYETPNQKWYVIGSPAVRDYISGEIHMRQSNGCELKYLCSWMYDRLLRNQDHVYIIPTKLSQVPFYIRRVCQRIGERFTGGDEDENEGQRRERKAEADQDES